MSKILITATNAMTYHFLVPHIQELLTNGHTVDLACTNLEGYDELLHSKIDDLQVKCEYIRLDRSPFRISNYKGILDLKRIINKGKYDLVWTNEPVMSIATRLAANSARKHGTKVLYMVHGFHFFKGSSIMSWLVYYPIERIMAHFADALVTINKEDYQRGKTFAFKDVYYIHGIGLDTKKFKNTVADKEKKRIEIGVPNNSIMLFSVGELGSRKNHEVVIRALGKLKNSTIHYVICGEGVLESKLRNLCEDLGITDNVHFLGYRKDIAELCKIADIYVFPSQREGLGIGALEGMASGLPLISSYVNGIRDYTENGKTGFTCNPHHEDDFANAIIKLAESISLREKFGKHNQRVVEDYDVQNIKKDVLNIISTQLND